MPVLLSFVLPMADMKLHCAGPTGAIIGLTSDRTYNVRLPADAPANEEKWTQVTFDNPPAGQSPIDGSFTGSYMQVLPDDRDTYHQIHGEGSFVTMTGLEYVFDVASAGKHTLYLRWSAGDNLGSGDSLYVVMREYATDHIVPGEDTLKPKLVAIDAVPGQFSGCCWNNYTHSCECSETEVLACPRWFATATAARWVECPAGQGMMDAVTDPLWYLFAGQDDPAATKGSMGATKLQISTTDFASEPWDATCEATGTGSHDTGLDFAVWTLAAGRYRLVIYPREDGTAVDAFYLAGPGVAPPNGLTLMAGASTISGCSTDRLSVDPDGVGRGATHGSNDAMNWGHFTHYDPSLNAGAGCGHCLEPIAHSECPAPDVLEAMITCDNVQLGELCEADGECNTDVHMNNCNSPPPPPAVGTPAADGSQPRTHGNRNNDVYKRVLCSSPNPPPSPPPSPLPPGIPLAASLATTSNGGSSDDPTGTIILVLFLILAAGVVVVAVRKGWVKPMLEWVRGMMGGDGEASAYIRNRDSGPGIAPMSRAGLDASFSPSAPQGSSTYNPPA